MWWLKWIILPFEYSGPKLLSCVISLSGSYITNLTINSFNYAAVKIAVLALNIVSLSNSIYPLFKKFDGIGDLL